MDVDRADGGVDTTFGRRQGQIREVLNPPLPDLPPLPGHLYFS